MSRASQLADASTLFSDKGKRVSRLNDSMESASAINRRLDADVDQRALDTLKRRMSQLQTFEESHLDTYIDSLTGKLSLIDRLIEQPTAADIDRQRFERDKADRMNEYDQMRREHDQATENKAMLKEETRARLVERADLVGEVEEVEIIIDELKSQLRHVDGFYKLDEEYACYLTIRRGYYESARAHLHSPTQHGQTRSNEFSVNFDIEADLRRAHLEFTATAEHLLESMEANDEVTFAAFGDYLETQERLRVLDERIFRNILKVERDLAANQKHLEAWLASTKASLESLNALMLQLVEQQDRFDRNQETDDQPLREYIQERQQILSDLETLAQQKQALNKRQQHMHQDIVRMLDGSRQSRKRSSVASSEIVNRHRILQSPNDRQQLDSFNSFLEGLASHKHSMSMSTKPTGAGVRDGIRQSPLINDIGSERSMSTQHDRHSVVSRLGIDSLNQFSRLSSVLSKKHTSDAQSGMPQVDEGKHFRSLGINKQATPSSRLIQPDDEYRQHAPRTGTHRPAIQSHSRDQPPGSTHLLDKYAGMPDTNYSYLFEKRRLYEMLFDGKECLRDHSNLSLVSADKLTGKQTVRASHYLSGDQKENETSRFCQPRDSTSKTRRTHIKNLLHQVTNMKKRHAKLRNRTESDVKTKPGNLLFTPHAPKHGLNDSVDFDESKQSAYAAASGYKTTMTSSRTQPRNQSNSLHYRSHTSGNNQSMQANAAEIKMRANFSLFKKKPLASYDHLPVFNPFNSSIPPTSCGFEEFNVRFDSSIFVMSPVQAHRNADKIVFGLSQVLRVHVSPSTVDFARKRQIGNFGGKSDWYLVSLEVEVEQEPVRLDLILTSLPDYSNFMQLKKRLTCN